MWCPRQTLLIDHGSPDHGAWNCLYGFVLFHTAPAATANQSEVAYIQWNPFVSLSLYLLKFLKGWGIYFILYLSPVPRGRSNAETLQMQRGHGAFQGRPSLRPTVCPQGSTRLWEKGASLLQGGEQKEENSGRKECPFLLYCSPSWKKEKRKTNTSQPKAY